MIAQNGSGTATSLIVAIAWPCGRSTALIVAVIAVVIGVAGSALLASVGFPMGKGTA